MNFQKFNLKKKIIIKMLTDIF